MTKNSFRFLLYNIRYCTGYGWKFHWPLPFSGYLKYSIKHMFRIGKFIKQFDPDIVGLVEVDLGSFRSKRFNQAERIGLTLGHYQVFESKYKVKSSLLNVPVFRHQGNAFLTRQDIGNVKFHYFEHGIKRLVIELELENCVFFLVHLSLKFRHRQHQLTHLAEIIKNTSKPVIVAGDFNVFRGNIELQLFLRATNLINANTEGLKTFPSKAPRRQLDYILHSPNIRVTNFEILESKLSDHLPLVCDFSIN